MASHKSEEMTGSSKAGSAIAVLALIVAVVALVLVIIVWAKPELVLDTDDDDDNGNMSDNRKDGAPMGPGWAPPGEKDGRPVIFGLGYSWKPFEYIDSSTGEIEGFTKDLVEAICEEMGKNCDFYMYNDYSSCWNEATWSAAGLADQWFDVCAGWVKTVSRARVYEQFGSYSDVAPAQFFVKEDSTLTEVDLANHDIVFRVGYYTNAACVGRLLDEDVANAHEAADADDAIQGVIDGDYDAYFAATDGDFPGLKPIGENIRCELKPNGMMARKEFAPSIKGWFEEGLQRIKDNGKYAFVCRLATTVHGGDPLCIEDD